MYKLAMMEMGPNNCKTIVWTFGEFFIYIFFVLINYWLFFVLLRHYSDYIKLIAKNSGVVDISPMKNSDSDENILQTIKQKKKKKIVIAHQKNKSLSSISTVWWSQCLWHFFHISIYWLSCQWSSNLYTWREHQLKINKKWSAEKRIFRCNCYY